MYAEAEQQTSSPSMASIAFALTLLAGYVDAIGYLSLGHVYVANMSGNSIAIGIHSAGREWPQVWRYAWPVVSFTLGLFVSRLLVSWGMIAGWRSVAAPAIVVEMVALLAFSIMRGGPAGVLAAGVAMGIQAATLARFYGSTVYTCFVTGSLVRFAENGADVLIGCVRSGSGKPGDLRRATWFALIWTAYVAGATLGASALWALAETSIWIAIAGLSMLCVVDLISPARLDKSIP